MVAVALKYFPFDRNLAFADGLTLTATGNVQFAAADVIIDTIGGRFDGSLLMQVVSIKISATNESYLWLLQGSNDPTFASGVENLIMEDMGAAAARLGGASAASVVGLHEMPFCNNRAGVEYRYLRLRAVLGGTAPSIVLQQIFLAPDSD